MERHINFKVGHEMLHGLVHEPEQTGTIGPLVVFLHGWAGSRIGPHRMFVHMARRLTDGGCVCLRFDFRGRGDSEGSAAQASIRSMIADTAAALDFIVPRYPGREVILLAICSGCKVAIGTAAADPRVTGLALWSPEPMGPLRDTASKTRKSAGVLRAYGRKLLHPETWRKLLTFRVNVRLVTKAMTRQEIAGQNEIADETRWLDRLRSYKGRMLLIHGSNDPETPTARAGYTSFCSRCGIPHQVHEIAGANHSFYGLAWEREVLDLTEAWVGCSGIARG
jgi:pimeloyl-ACP methyl ester carboxylesterase